MADLKAENAALRGVVLKQNAALWAMGECVKLLREADDWRERPGNLDFGQWFDRVHEALGLIPEDWRDS